MFISCIFAVLLVVSSEQSAVSALGYHAFNDSGNLYSFSIDELEEQIDFFKNRGYTFVQHSDIVEGNILGTKNILVTIDDGHRSAYMAWREVFEPRGIKPLIAVYPGVTGRAGFALTWEQLESMTQAGCEVASHGYNHLRINRELYDSDPDAFRREIYYSREILEKRLGIPVEIFVYPYGIKSDVTIEHVEKAGYSFAYSITSGSINLPVASELKYELQRYMLTRNSAGVVLGRIAGDEFPGETIVASREIVSSGRPAKISEAGVSHAENNNSEIREEEILPEYDLSQDVSDEHIEEIRKIYRSLLTDSYSDYADFHERFKYKLKDNKKNIQKLFDLTREADKENDNNY